MDSIGGNGRRRRSGRRRSSGEAHLRIKPGYAWQYGAIITRGI